MVQDADGRADPAEIAGALADLARWLQTAQGDDGWLAALRFGVAGALVQTGDAALAGDGFRRILSENPGHLWAWIGLIDLAMARGDATAALIARQALVHLPEDAILRRKSAEAVEQAEGPGAALAVLDPLARPDLTIEDLRYAIALHRSAQRVDQALPLIDRLLTLAPEDALALLARIEARLALGDVAGAVAAGQSAQALHPDHAEIGLRLTQACARFEQPDSAAALCADLDALLAQDGPPPVQSVEAWLARIAARVDLPWYVALDLVARAQSRGVPGLAEAISAACDNIPWPTADRHAFAIEDALLRHGPRTALDWIAAHPTAHRDAEAAERIGRVLVQAGTGPLAARYLARCCRRWPGDGALLDRATEAMIACGAADLVGGLCDSLPPGPEVGVARLRAGVALGQLSGPDIATGPALPLMIERHLLAGDLAAAEACLARLTPGDGPQAEALICRPRATRLGAILNEARILAARGVDWMASDPAALAPFAVDFFLSARRLIQLSPTPEAPAGARPGLVHLIWPAPPGAEEGRRIVEAWARQGLGPVRVTGPGEGRDLMRRHGASAARPYDTAHDDAQRADLVALACLLHEGGWWWWGRIGRGWGLGLGLRACPRR